MKILIYGSSGFIGRYVVEVLKDNTLILPVRNTEKAENLFKDYENIYITHLDQYKPGISIEMEKPDVVINLIGILKEDPDRDITFEKVHFEFSKELINSALKSNVKKFIQMSALGADINSKSRYLKTKAMAEQYLINSGLNYIIFRPSIIMGKEQKLFQDLKKYSKLSPFFLAPVDVKVQPVHVLDVAECFKKVSLENIRNEIFELCGNRVITFKELFEFALLYIDTSRPVIGIPEKFFLPLIPIFSLLPDPVMTLDQYYMLEKDNVCSKNFRGVKELLGKVRDAFNI
ncbi:MAG: NAD(P)H-binding protein [Hydrogenothermaceae bacterium]